MTGPMTETVSDAADRTRVAVVLARGLGTRMRASSTAGSGLTSQQATAAASGYKALMPIGEHRLIDYSLSALADAGIERAVLVVGPEHEDFRRHVDSLECARLTIDLAVQVNPLGTADAVLSAEAAVGEESFLMVNGDNYYPRQVLRDLARHRGNALAGFDRAALVAESNIPAERIAAFALVRACDGALGEIVEKPSAEAVRAAGAHAPVSMNAFRFTPEIFSACRRITPSPRGELEIVDAVRALPGPVSVLPATGGVLDLSRREDIREVEARLSGTKVSL
ncbi:MULTISPECIES: nucleotidyltransferase family protein [Actinomyces]|uniref:Glucose-1-phosphate thymidylyltransferase n=1 Tax=Actinomyces oris TaxID=544580 RepID=A0A1Q8VMD6_9ACTO|nr:nucleotidyltransferase family protein [Actinomyces oris]OLO49245.1 glucose-1-phosphate thymidylyltransferase [Actinomyces oris]